MCYNLRSFKTFLYLTLDHCSFGYKIEYHYGLACHSLVLLGLYFSTATMVKNKDGP